MSASTTLMHELTYREQLKLARAEMVVGWTTAAVDHAIGLLKIEPEVFAREDDQAVRQPWYGCIY